MKLERRFYAAIVVSASVLCLGGVWLAFLAELSWQTALIFLVLLSVLWLQYMGHARVRGLLMQRDELQMAREKVLLDTLGSHHQRLMEQQGQIGRQTKAEFAQLQSLANDLLRRMKISHNAMLQNGSAVRSELKTRAEQIPGEVVDLWRSSRLLVEDFADLPATGGWAVTVPTLVAMLNELGRNCSRKTIVECGSGTSTVWLAMALRHKGEGHVYALEHNSEFADVTRNYLRRNDLEDWATIVDAPLTKHEIDGDEYLWYSLDGIEQVHSIDLLFVDGPPAATGPKARYAAFPAFAGRLSEEAWVILDDTVRQEERDIASAWLSSDVGGVHLSLVSDLPKAMIMVAQRASLEAD